MNCLFPVSDSQPTATELFQSQLYGSGTVFHSTSHLLRHFLSSAVAWRHSSNSVTRNYCCRACEVTLSFMDTLIALTCILPYLIYVICADFQTVGCMVIRISIRKLKDTQVRLSRNCCHGWFRENWWRTVNRRRRERKQASNSRRLNHAWKSKIRVGSAAVIVIFRKLLAPA